MLKEAALDPKGDFAEDHIGVPNLLAVGSFAE
jgi:hypothetical protein